MSTPQNTNPEPDPGLGTGAAVTRDQKKALAVLREHDGDTILPAVDAKGAQPDIDPVSGERFVWVNSVILLNLEAQGHVRRRGRSHIYDLVPERTSKMA